MGKKKKELVPGTTNDIKITVIYFIENGVTFAYNLQISNFMFLIISKLFLMPNAM
jgi:hypothetical protein